MSYKQQLLKQITNNSQAPKYFNLTKKLIPKPKSDKIKRLEEKIDLLEKCLLQMSVEIDILVQNQNILVEKLKIIN